MARAFSLTDVLQVRVVELGDKPRFDLVVALGHQAAVGVEHHDHIGMRLYGGVEVVVDGHRGELFLQRPHQPVDRTLRIGTVDERLADLRIHLRILRAIDRNGVVVLKVLLGVDGVFAVKHRHRLRVLQAGDAVGDRREMAGRIGGNSRYGGGNAAGEHARQKPAGLKFSSR